MPELIAISKENHADKSWSRYTSYRFASRDNLAPMVISEIAKSVCNFPMAFIKQQDSFILVAVLSLTPGRNMFVAPDGQWLGSYVPAAFRGYPFRLAKAEDRDDPILCVDVDSGLINADPDFGEPFFDEFGEVSKPVKDVLDFLSQIEQSRVATELAVASLADAGIIIEWNLKLKDGEQEKPVTGLYMVDEAKLSSLDDSEFLKLRKAQALPIAYGQLLSMDNIQIFERLAKLHEQMVQPQEPQLDNFFQDDDIIRF